MQFKTHFNKLCVESCSNSSRGPASNGWSDSPAEAFKLSLISETKSLSYSGLPVQFGLA